MFPFLKRNDKKYNFNKMEKKLYKNKLFLFYGSFKQNYF